MVWWTGTSGRRWCPAIHRHLLDTAQYGPAGPAQGGRRSRGERRRLREPAQPPRGGREGAAAGLMLDGNTLFNPNDALVDELPLDVAAQLAR